MILKLMSHHTEHSDWHYWDNIDELTIQGKGVVKGMDVEVAHDFSKQKAFSQGDKNGRFIGFKCRGGFFNSREINWVCFDGPAFLLNDEGKTIERL